VPLIVVGALLWRLQGPVVGAPFVVPGVLCLIGAAVWHRFTKPPPHAERRVPRRHRPDELERDMEARVVFNVILLSAGWVAIIVLLFVKGQYAFGGTMLAMAIVGPLIAFRLAGSATRTHRRRRRKSNAVRDDRDT
jgi:hypothetical protein